MDLFVIVLALAFVQIWGAKSPLHRDSWFARWMGSVSQKQAHSHSLIAFMLSLVPPCLVLILVIALLSHITQWLALPIFILILLYSLGRGEFTEIVREYTQACYVEDWPSAIERARPLGIPVDNLVNDDWSTLHRYVLEEASYRGFERMFAVIFWFFFLGPVAAFCYRLTFLFCEKNPENLYSSKFLWAIEWPAVRLLGISFALTGNFVGCFQRWKESLWCEQRTSRNVLSELVFGALTVSDSLNQTCEITRKELGLISKLYTRTLWFWLGMVSIILLLM